MDPFTRAGEIMAPSCTLKQPTDLGNYVIGQESKCVTKIKYARHVRGLRWKSILIIIGVLC